MFQPRSLAVMWFLRRPFPCKLSAAKVVEAAGIFALGQDLEEW
jgi:hypothetical protein